MNKKGVVVNYAFFVSIIERVNAIPCTLIAAAKHESINGRVVNKQDHWGFLIIIICD
jgi:hypothetical protein